MYEVWFCNGPITSDSRMCQVPDFHAALAVWDAMCAKFLVVTLFADNGDQIRHYDNR